MRTRQTPHSPSPTESATTTSTQPARADPDTVSTIDGQAENDVQEKPTTPKASHAILSASIEQRTTEEQLQNVPMSSSTRLKNLLLWLKEAGYNLADKEDLKILKWGTISDVDGVVLHDGENAAQLTLVARISEDGFNLTPHGGWRQDNTFSKELSKQKATANLVSPQKIPFDAYYEEAKRNIKELQIRAAHPGTDIISVVKEDGIRISWPLFERRPTEEKEDWLGDATVDKVTSATEWNDWPVPANVRNELNHIKTSHVPLQLPAYDVTGNLISPTYWREELQGAVVKLKLVMRYYYIAKDNKSTFVLIPYDIVVIGKPVVTSRSPTKKRKLEDGPSENTRRRPPPTL
ncbi:hypothetical protein CALCODRAFT_506554 [Calocera cornea HHB12733]|uniref:Uncharacterized protein n=1 Tax=Calocera cornea HHB12733 TaxID=1353952 RepID=A0A165ISJ2_9BASI|nr:hypothetical protein CALCODRAFT_506554 [Calocera cornea HHB12733]